jgi:hypothetical protein
MDGQNIRIIRLCDCRNFVRGWLVSEAREVEEARSTQGSPKKAALSSHAVRPSTQVLSPKKIDSSNKCSTHIKERLIFGEKPKRPIGGGNWLISEIRTTTYMFLTWVSYLVMRESTSKSSSLRTTSATVSLTPRPPRRKPRGVT